MSLASNGKRDVREWSEEQKAALQALQSGETSIHELTKGGVYNSADESAEFEREPRLVYSVTVEECEKIQEKDANGTPRVDIADEHNLSLKRTRYHADGDCQHVSPTCVDDRRCNVIREMARDGIAYQSIADRLSGVSRRAAQYHAVGDCAHDSGVEPVEHRHSWKEADR